MSSRVGYCLLSSTSYTPCASGSSSFSSELYRPFSERFLTQNRYIPPRIWLGSIVLAWGLASALQGITTGFSGMMVCVRERTILPPNEPKPSSEWSSRLSKLVEVPPFHSTLPCSTRERSSVCAGPSFKHPRVSPTRLLGELLISNPLLIVQRCRLRHRSAAKQLSSPVAAGLHHRVCSEQDPDLNRTLLTPSPHSSAVFSSS